MTTYEHAMLGGTLALALGCQQRQGWGVVAAAAVAGALPDWDGLSLAFGGAAYAEVHRVWGHNLLAAACTGVLAGFVGYIWMLSVQRRPLAVAGPSPRRFRGSDLAEWLIAGLLGSWVHLPADMIYAGHPDMHDWPLLLLWPFSRRGWALPVVPWGDVVASLIFVGEMFALYRWPRRGSSIAWLTLALVHGYVGVRWMLA